MFPTIRHLDDLRPHIADRKEINITTQPNGYHVVCYSISTPDTFFDLDPVKTSFLRECRGITFYPDGKLASRPLHKFFNVGEREETQVHNLDLTDNDVVRFMDKRDGSMLHPVRMEDDSIVLKSKKSFTSDVAIQATEFLHLPQNENVLKFCEGAMFAGYTPIFEFTAPNNRIVLNYRETELRLLQMRANESGNYITDKKVFERLAADMGILLVEEHDLDDLADKIRDVETATEIEGYIFQFKNGNMVKMKTPWYMALHHTVTFTRARDVAEMVLNETVDDYKSYLASVKADHTMEQVLEIERKIVAQVLAIEEEVKKCIAEIPEGALRKDVAAQFKSHQYFKLIMDLFSDKEPYYSKFYAMNYLKDDFGLEQL